MKNLNLPPFHDVFAEYCRLKSLSKDKLELEVERQKAKQNQVWRVKEALTFCNLNCAFDCIS